MLLEKQNIDFINKLLPDLIRDCGVNSILDGFKPILYLLGNEDLNHNLLMSNSNSSAI